MLHLECNRHKVSRDLGAIADDVIKSDVFFVLDP